MLETDLKKLLVENTKSTDFQNRAFNDIEIRIQKLHDCDLLPRGPRKAGHLSTDQVVTGIFSISCTKPEYGGFAAKILCGLLPVGGRKVSFRESTTAQQAIGRILEDKEALAEVVEVRVSGSEIGINGHGRVAITYQTNGVTKTAWYVGGTAVSLLRPGGEDNHNPNDTYSPILTEFVFTRQFFKIAHAAHQNKYPIPDHLIVEETDPEKQKAERAARLNIKRNSCYLNIGVDCQVCWPKEETLVEFEGKQIILMPKTRENTTSLHIDLVYNKIDEREARTLFNRFLSIMTWCDDQYAILQNDWSGNPVPVAVPKRDLAFSTAHHWAFSRKIPADLKAQRALALYREGRNAQQNFLIPYAVLSYYKIFEVKFRDRKESNPEDDENGMPRKKILTWFDQKLPSLGIEAQLKRLFEVDCKNRFEQPADYLYKACRCAVAHSKQLNKSSDPDEASEQRRLYIASDVLRMLSRILIQEEFQISVCFFDGT